MLNNDWPNELKSERVTLSDLTHSYGLYHCIRCVSAPPKYSPYKRPPTRSVFLVRKEQKFLIRTWLDAYAKVPHGNILPP